MVVRVFSLFVVAIVVGIMVWAVTAKAHHGHHNRPSHPKMRTVVCALLEHERQAHPSKFQNLPEIACSRL